MTVGLLVAVLALGLVAVATAPGDGRAETALALPLIAAVGVATPAALVAVLGGVALAYGALVTLEARTLCFGRRLRAVAATVGAVGPLSILAVGAFAGSIPPHPEVWLAGAVVPGVLAYDLRRLPAGRRSLVVATSAVGLAALVGIGVLLQARLADASLHWWAPADTAALSSTSLGSIAVLVLVSLVAGVAVRWRYGLHVGPLSVPLVALWSLETPLVPSTYVAALALTWLSLPILRRQRGGRRLAAVCGAGGGLVALGTLALAGSGGQAVWVVVVLAGVFGAEDARLLGEHAGRDRTHAVAIAASGYALVVTAAGIAADWTVTELPTAVLAASITSLLVLGLVFGRRERVRPTERRLRSDEWRWTP